MALRRLLPIFLVSCMLFVFSSSVSAASDKVNLSLYYETLCRECSRFMVKSLPKLFSTGLIDIVNLHLVPYGYTKRKDEEFICTHGEDECHLNKVEACAIYTFPDPKLYWPFLQCAEELVGIDDYSAFELCFNVTGLPSESIMECARSELGTLLLKRYGDETNHLIPPLKYLPWIVINGAPYLKHFDDFLKSVCEAYKGDPKPEPCQNLLHNPSVLKAEDLSVKQVHPVMNVTPNAP